MFDKLRNPLLLLTAFAMLYGAWQFYAGREVVETERRTRKPKSVTLDDLVLNPPKKIGEWVTITDGGASLPRATYRNPEMLPETLRRVMPEVAVYAPIFPTRLAYKTETQHTLKTVEPDVYVVLRTEKPDVMKRTRTFLNLSHADAGTIDQWLEQNKHTVVLRPPFTGTLFPRREPHLGDPPEAQVNGLLHANGFVLYEGSKPPIAENVQVAWGLTLLMGLPTVWLFALLFAGKLDPPDDAPVAGEIPAARTAPLANNTPSGSGRTYSASSSSAMPIGNETQTPRK